MNLWTKALALWLAILVLAVINGALREAVLMPALGNASGLVASGAVLAMCISLVAWVGVPWFGRLRARQWLLIGACWLVLTLVFEFGFGRLAQHKTWPELLEAYTFKDGNLWSLVLAATFLAPWCAARFRGAIR